MIHHYYCPITRQTVAPTVTSSQCGGFYFAYGIYFPEYRGHFSAVIDAANNQLISATQYAHAGSFNRSIYRETQHRCWNKIQGIAKELVLLHN